MIERLNTETRAYHAEADSDFDILFREDASASLYLVYLMRVYGFEAPLEVALSMTPNLELMIALRERQKSHHLANDLLALGLRPHEVAEVPRCLTIPQARGAAEALGWMYVIERSTLAHSVIRRHLLTKLPREMHRASEYFQCYAGVVGTRWRHFGSVLDDVASSPAIANRIIASAGEAFRAQRRWIQHEHQGTHARAV
ncbi:MAG: biliverdin-producing heme oxygenase [Kofleriaceae bacterium]